MGKPTLGVHTIVHSGELSQLFPEVASAGHWGDLRPSGWVEGSPLNHLGGFFLGTQNEKLALISDLGIAMKKNCTQN